MGELYECKSEGEFLVMTDTCVSTSVTSEECDEVCELENIQKQLQELVLNKLQLETQRENVTLPANRGYNYEQINV